MSSYFRRWVIVAICAAIVVAMVYYSAGEGVY